MLKNCDSVVEKFFLALDYSTHKEAEERALNALDFLEKQYGERFVADRTGLKINEDLYTGRVPDGVFPQDTPAAFGNLNLEKQTKRFQIFADLKIGHGADTGKRIIERAGDVTSIDYTTVAASLGREILKEYVEIGKESGTKIIAFTQHTKTPEADILEMYGRHLRDVIFSQAKIASEAGLDAAVMEAAMLKDERIKKLPIKKLVTGIRIDPTDLGTQRRVSSLEDIANVKRLTNYAVVSSRYLGDKKKLKEVIDTLL